MSPRRFLKGLLRAWAIELAKFLGAAALLLWCVLGFQLSCTPMLTETEPAMHAIRMGAWWAVNLVAASGVVAWCKRGGQ